MKQIKLHHKDNHIFIKDNLRLFVYDTGGPKSFGVGGLNPLNDEEIPYFYPDEEIRNSYPVFTDAKKLSDFFNFRVDGLIGTDTLNQYDHILDLKTNTLTFSKQELKHQGHTLSITFSNILQGVPMLVAKIDTQLSNFIFDTGAQYSYYNDTIPKDSTPMGHITDYWPPIGTFKTHSYKALVKLNDIETYIHFGVPPAELSKLLKASGAKGILGNELMRNRVTGYFPRRNELVLQS
jgi:hypothetical protein